MMTKRQFLGVAYIACPNALESYPVSILSKFSKKKTVSPRPGHPATEKEKIAAWRNVSVEEEVRSHDLIWL